MIAGLLLLAAFQGYAAVVSGSVARGAVAVLAVFLAASLAGRKGS